MTLDPSGLSPQGRSLDALYHPGDDWPIFRQRVAKAHDLRWQHAREAWLDELYQGLFPEQDEEPSADTDAAGWPVFIYDHWFAGLIIAAALELGWYQSVREAVVMRGLYDRYCKRGEWTFDILVAAFWEPDLPPGPDEAALYRFWSAREGLSTRAVAQLAAGQATLPLFADV